MNRVLSLQLLLIAVTASELTMGSLQFLLLSTEIITVLRHVLVLANASLGMSVLLCDMTPPSVSDE